MDAPAGKKRWRSGGIHNPPPLWGSCRNRPKADESVGGSDLESSAKSDVRHPPPARCARHLPTRGEDFLATIAAGHLKTRRRMMAFRDFSRRRKVQMIDLP